MNLSPLSLIDKTLIPDNSFLCCYFILFWLVGFFVALLDETQSTSNDWHLFKLEMFEINVIFVLISGIGRPESFVKQMYRHLFSFTNGINLILVLSYQLSNYFALSSGSILVYWQSSATLYSHDIDMDVMKKEKKKKTKKKQNQYT